MTDPLTVRSIEIGLAYWGAQPVCLPHAVRFDHPDPAGRARAEQPGCRIWIDTGTYGATDPVFYCNLVGHEIGHNLGHGHESDPTHIMNPVVPLAIPGCQEFVSDEARIDRERVEQRWLDLAEMAFARRALCRKLRRRRARAAPRRCRQATATSARARALRRTITWPIW